MTYSSNNTINYAKSHDVVRISAKRYDQSPYHERYVNDQTIFGVYANRFYPLSLGGDPIKDYWNLRHKVMLYDVPERPLAIKGPDAVKLLEKVFTRKISNLKLWRARYAIACTPQGGIQMDGVLIRQAEDYFWYIKANGEFDLTLMAHADGLDIEIYDPQSWVIQIQGPNAMQVLEAANDGEMPEKFNYFFAGKFSLGGQKVLVSRTGWTGEMGFEIYSNPNIDHLAMWDHIMACGEPFGIQYGSLESMGIRRIEAGILDNGTDIDTTMTPFEAGLGMFVDFSKPDFVGRSALEKAERHCLLYGLITETGSPSSGYEVLAEETIVGRITAGGWSPTLEKGIGYVRFAIPSTQQNDWLGQTVTLRDGAGQLHESTVVTLPFYDAEKKIPRGLT